MTGTWLELRAEAYRALHSPGSRLVLASTALVAAARVCGGFVAERIAAARRLTGAFAAGLESPATTATANAYPPFLDGVAAGMAIAVLLSLAFAAATIAAERDAGTIRLPITRSVSRGGLLLAKAMFALLWAVALSAAAFLGAFLAAAAFYDFGPIVESRYEIFSAHEINRELLKAALAALPPLFASVGLGMLISSIARTGTEAVGITLVLYLMFDLFKDLAGDGKAFVFATFNPAIVDRSLLHEVGQLARGISTAGYSDKLLLLNLIVPIAQGLVFFGLAAVVFGRRRL
ncbi:MAG: ABC transporter permease subunit [Planctomycetota bacterium]